MYSSAFGRKGGGGEGENTEEGGRLPPVRPYAKERGRRGELAAVPEGTASRKIGGRPVRQAPPPNDYILDDPALPLGDKAGQSAFADRCRSVKKFRKSHGTTKTYDATCKKEGKVCGVNCVRKLVLCCGMGSLEV